MIILMMSKKLTMLNPPPPKKNNHVHHVKNKPVLSIVLNLNNSETLSWNLNLRFSNK